MTAAVEVQDTFDLFAPPPPPPVPEAVCEPCGKHLRGWHDVMINHGHGMYARRGLGRECTAMHLTLNHVEAQMRNIASPDVEWHLKSSTCKQCSRRRKTTREHVQQYYLDGLDHYLRRVHEVWPESKHKALDAYLAARARHLGVAALIAGDEVPE